MSDVIIDDRNLKRIIAATPGMMTDITGAIAYDIEAKWKAKMGTGNAGRAYKGHVASAPGGPPAIDTGAFRNSIHTTKVGDAFEVSDGVEYGVYLEFGTVSKTKGYAPGNTRMLPRPSLQPAIDDATRDAPAIIRAIAGRTLR